MRPIFISAAAALGLALLAASPVIAGDYPSNVEKFTGSVFDTTLDLGFDVSGVPHTPAAAKEFLFGLRADWQPKVIAACARFLQYPNEIRSQETYAFCHNALS